MPTDTFTVAPPDGGAAGTGDAYDDRGAGVAFTTASNWDRIGGSSSTTLVCVTGLSFPINVPEGATITNAYVKVWRYSVGSADIPKGRASVQPIPNPTKWVDNVSSTGGGPAYRFFGSTSGSTPAYTTTTFDETAWDSAWDGDGNGYQIPLTVADIQTIIDHATYDPTGIASVRTVNVMLAGPTTGNTFNIVSQDNGVGGQANQKPKLVIEYATAGNTIPTAADIITYGPNDPVISKVNLAAVGETYSPVLTGVLIPLEFGPSSSIGALQDPLATVVLEEIPPNAFPGILSHPTVATVAGTGAFEQTNGFFTGTAISPIIVTVTGTGTFTLQGSNFPSTPTASNTVVTVPTTGKLDAVTVDFVLSSAPPTVARVAGTGLFVQTAGFFTPETATVPIVASVVSSGSPGTSGGNYPSANAEVYGVANVGGTGLFFRASIPSADSFTNTVVSVVTTGTLAVLTSDLPVSSAPSSVMRTSGTAAFYSPSSITSTGSYIRTVPSLQRGPGAPVNTRRRPRR